MSTKLLRWLAAACMLLLACAAGAQTPVLALGANGKSIEPQVVWASVAGRQVTVEDAARGKLPLRPESIDTIFDLDSGNALWLHLRLQAATAQPWVLQFPQPTLDSVTLWQKDAAGQWTAVRAGDRVPVAQWPEAGRYPFFRLQLEPGEVTDLFVEVRYPLPVSLPLRVVTTNSHDYRTQLEFLALGMALGALATLLAIACYRAWRLRDRAYALFAAHALVSALAVAAFTGVGGQWIWPGAVSWVDASPGCLAMLGAGFALMIVERLAAFDRHRRMLGLALRVGGFAGPLLALAYVFMPRRAGVVLLGAYVLVVAVLAITSAVLTWRRGDPVGRWMAAGTVPLAAAVLVAIARVYNWIGPSWVTEYAVVMALTFDLPTLLGALNSRSRERRSAQLRQLASSSQDALTGLLKAGPFFARLRQAIARWERTGESAAVAVIELANYALIKANLGSEAAEESLLRGVIRLRKIVRDVDTTGRIGEARFGLVLEGVESRDAVRQLATRLIAWGLMPDDESPGAPVLQFHVAALLVPQLRGADPVAALLATLRAMSPGTRKPFRFADPHGAPPDSVASDPQSV